MSRRQRTSMITGRAGRVATTSAMCALALGVVAAVRVLPSAGAAEMPAGPLLVVGDDNTTPLTSGGSSTPFIFKLPDLSVCMGDTANAGYRLQSFLVPESVGLDTLRFDSSGPVPVAGQFRSPFYDTGGTPYVSRFTAVALVGGGPGPIVQPLPTFDFAVFDTVAFPVTAGVYKVGIACTLGPADSPTQLDKYWSTTMTITADPDDPGPADIRFMVTATDPTTTSTTQLGATSTTQLGATPTSTTQLGAPTTSTTQLGGSTTSTSVEGSATSTQGTSGSDDGTAGTGGSGQPGGSLPRSGGGPLPLMMWSFVLLCLGRAAVLLARRRPTTSEER